MTRISRLVFVVLSNVLLVSLPDPSHAQLIQNGGFEDPTVPSGGTLEISPGQTIGDAWLVLGDPGTHVQLVHKDLAEPHTKINKFNSHGGNNSLDLTGNVNQGLSVGVKQVVPTIEGQRYRISFFIGKATASDNSNTGYKPSPKLRLLIDGKIAGPPFFNNPYSTWGEVNWLQRSYEFVAAGNTTTITFKNLTRAPYGPYYVGLDDVEITPIRNEKGCCITKCRQGRSGCGSRRRCH